MWLSEGRARYRNRWVRTRGMRAEERAGRALFGGIMSPAFVEPSLLGGEPDPGWPRKLDACINVVRHAGRILALGEGVPPYGLTPELDTVGPVTFDGAVAAGMCAHPRFDPDTGEMIYFRYGTSAPYLTWGAVGPDGAATRPPTPVDGVDDSFMIHDFAITENYLVLVVAPLLIDVDAMFTGGDVLRWRPELGTRIGMVRRRGDGPARWISTETFWAWHYANAYEEGPGGSRIVLDLPWWNRPHLRGSTRASAPTLAAVRRSFTRATLDADTGSVELRHLNYSANEFPRIDDRRAGRPHRYVTVAGRSADDRLIAGEYDRLVRHDMVEGRSVGYDAGVSIGETVFAPRDGATEELDGYYLTFATSMSDDRSWLYVWDAADFPTNPRAKVRLPRRIPNGLHAAWFPADPPAQRDRRDRRDRRVGDRRAADRRRS